MEKTKQESRRNNRRLNMTIQTMRETPTTQQHNITKLIQHSDQKKKKTQYTNTQLRNGRGNERGRGRGRSRGEAKITTAKQNKNKQNNKRRTRKKIQRTNIKYKHHKNK